MFGAVRIYDPNISIEIITAWFRRVVAHTKVEDVSPARDGFPTHVHLVPTHQPPIHIFAPLVACQPHLILVTRSQQALQ